MPAMAEGTARAGIYQCIGFEEQQLEEDEAVRQARHNAENNVTKEQLQKQRTTEKENVKQYEENGLGTKALTLSVAKVEITQYGVADDKSDYGSATDDLQRVALTAARGIKVETENMGVEFEQMCTDIEEQIVLMRGKDELKRVASSLGSISNALGKLSAADVGEVLKAFGEISYAVSVLIPGVDKIGKAGEGVFKLISSIFCIAGVTTKAQSDDIGSIVQKVVDEALQKYDDKILRAGATGVKKLFVTSRAFLVGMKGKHLSENDVNAVLTSVPVYQGIEYMGQLASRIADSSKGCAIPTNVVPEANRAIAYLELYCRLAMLRDALLYQMLVLIQTTHHGQNIASSVNKVIESHKTEDMKVLECLMQPTKHHAVILSLFNASEHPLIIFFMKTLGCSFQNLNHLTESPRMLKLPAPADVRVFMSSLPVQKGHVFLRSMDKDGEDKDLFRFQPVDMDNHFHICSEKWPDYFLHLINLTSKTGIMRGRTPKSGPKGVWKVVRFHNGKFVLSPKGQPTNFACGSLLASVHPTLGKIGNKIASREGTVGQCSLIPTDLAQWEVE